MRNRPKEPHPDVLYWVSLTRIRRKLQTIDGKLYCGTCSKTSATSSDFELHHRHYDRFGEERIEDVILLCKGCHAAVTFKAGARKYKTALIEDDVTDLVWRPQELAAWMEQHHITKIDFFRITGIARTTIDRYLSGSQPIPKIVLLACKALERKITA